MDLKGKPFLAVRKEIHMKKTLAVLLAAAALATSAYASPQTTFNKGEWQINAGMWDPQAKTKDYKSDGEWNFTGGLTYGINDKSAAQFQHYGLHTDHTGGHSDELNLLYSVHPQVALYTGYNHIAMSGFPAAAFGEESRSNDVVQVGVLAKQPVSEVVDLYAKGALGTKSTSIWEAGVDFALDKDLDLNAGYRYLNTQGGEDRNVSYQGWLAGVSYRFGGSKNADNESAYGDIDYSALDNGKEMDENDKTVVTINSDTPLPKDTTVVMDEEKVPENDYYFNSIHFGNDSDTPGADQTANLDAFVKAAKETGHTFKLVGRTDSNGSKEYNDNLAIRRVKKVADYAIAHGVKLDQLVGMYKGEENPVDTNDTESGRANNRRVDIFEHK